MTRVNKETDKLEREEGYAKFFLSLTESVIWSKFSLWDKFCLQIFNANI